MYINDIQNYQIIISEDIKSLTPVLFCLLFVCISNMNIKQSAMAYHATEKNH